MGPRLQLRPLHRPAQRRAHLPAAGHPQPRRRSQAARRQGQVLGLHLQVQGDRLRLHFPLARDPQPREHRQQLLELVAAPLAQQPRAHRPQLAPLQLRPGQHAQLRPQRGAVQRGPPTHPIGDQIEARTRPADQKRRQIDVLQIQPQRLGIPALRVHLRPQVPARRPRRRQHQIRAQHRLAQRRPAAHLHRRAHGVPTDEAADQVRFHPHGVDRQVQRPAVAAVQRQIDPAAAPGHPHAALALFPQRLRCQVQPERRPDRRQRRSLQMKLGFHRAWNPRRVPDLPRRNSGGRAACVPRNRPTRRPAAQRQVHGTVALQLGQLDGGQARGDQISQLHQPPLDLQAMHVQLQRRRVLAGRGWLRRRGRLLAGRDRPHQVPAPVGALQRQRRLLQPHLPHLDVPAQQRQRREHHPGALQLGHLLALGVPQHHPAQLDAAATVAEVLHLQTAGDGPVHPRQRQVARQPPAPLRPQRQERHHRQHHHRRQQAEQPHQDPPAGVVPAPHSTPPPRHQNASPMETWKEQSPSRTQEPPPSPPIPKQLSLTLAPGSLPGSVIPPGRIR